MKNRIVTKLRIRYVGLIIIAVLFAIILSEPLSEIIFKNSGFQFYMLFYLISNLLLILTIQFFKKSSSLKGICFNNIFPIYEKKIISRSFDLLTLENNLKKLNGKGYASRVIENNKYISLTVNSTHFKSGEQIEIEIVPNSSAFEISIISYSRNFFTLFDKGINILHVTSIVNIIEGNVEKIQFNPEKKNNGLLFNLSVSLIIIGAIFKVFHVFTTINQYIIFVGVLCVLVLSIISFINRPINNR